MDPVARHMATSRDARGHVPAPVAGFLGVSSASAVLLIGVGLLVYGGHLVVASWRTSVRPREIYYFSTGDLLWVTVTLALVASDSLLTTPSSVAVSLAVAAFVGTRGRAPVVGPVKGAHAGDAGRPFVESPDGRQRHCRVLAVDEAMGQVLVVRGQCRVPARLGLLARTPRALHARRIRGIRPVAGGHHGPSAGLTRLLGVAHVIPWIPLVAYVALRLSTGVVGPQLSRAAMPGQWSYAVVLLVTVGICLALDIADVWRWYGDERYRLGSVNAARAGHRHGRCDLHDHHRAHAATSDPDQSRSVESETIG